MAERRGSCSPPIRLFATNQAVAANTGAAATNTAAIAALDASAVQYDSGTLDTVTLGGAAGTRVTNVTAGTLAATSTDAVNGAQLFATNQTVAGITADGIRYDSAAHDTVTFDGAAGTRLTGVAAGTINPTSSDAVNGAQLSATNFQVAQNTAAIAAINPAAGNAVSYTDATLARVNLGGAAGTTIDNLADGTLSATSTEAVNGSQLFATNAAVTANTAAVGAVDGRVTINAGAIAALDASAVQYDSAAHDSITLDGAAGTRIGNVTDGTLSATSTEAVNGSQLFATNAAVTANTAAVGGLDGRVTTNTGAIAALDTRVATNATVGADNTAAITALDAAAVQYDDAAHGSITLDGAAGTRIGNVADGALDAASGDAVNGSQLFATNQDVATNSSAISTLDARTSATENSLTTIDSRVTVNTGNIATLQTQVANVPIGYVQADGTTPSPVPTNTAAMIGAGGGTVRVTNVTAGTLSATSSDAVNGAQLAATNTRVTANETAISANRTDIDRNTNNISTLTNNLAGSTVVAVQYSNPANPTRSNGGTVTNDVTLVGANASQPVALHNVANGTASTDATNLGQVEALVTSAMTTTQSAFTDRLALAMETVSGQLDQVNFDIRELRTDAMAGIASSMAFAGMPQTMGDGPMVSGGVAHYRGETAFSLGFSSSFMDGRSVFKAGASLDSRGNAGVAVGAGIGL